MVLNEIMKGNLSASRFDWTVAKYGEPPGKPEKTRQRKSAGPGEA